MGKKHHASSSAETDNWPPLICLSGFPPWLAANAELFPLPCLACVRPCHVVHALNALAGTVQRHGR